MNAPNAANTRGVYGAGYAAGYQAGLKGAALSGWRRLETESEVRTLPPGTLVKLLTPTVSGYSDLLRAEYFPGCSTAVLARVDKECECDWPRPASYSTCMCRIVDAMPYQLAVRILRAELPVLPADETQFCKI